MSTDEFLLEEYRYLTGGIRFHQTAYATLETYTVGGLALIYSALFGLGGVSTRVAFPNTFWWFIPILAFGSAFRCFQHYIVMRQIGHQIIRIEKQVFAQTKHTGFETYYASLRGFAGPKQFIPGNAIFWAITIGFTIAVATVETIR